MNQKLKVMAIASSGGHWVQLLRIRRAFNDSEVVFVSTHKEFKPLRPGDKFFSVTDASRWNKMLLIRMAGEVHKLIRQEKPDIVISTGAAPGMAGIILGKLYGCRTIWVDSIANVEQVSLSGRLIKPFADLHLTQWPELAQGKTLFKGTVIS